MRKFSKKQFYEYMATIKEPEKKSHANNKKPLIKSGLNDLNLFPELTEILKDEKKRKLFIEYTKEHLERYEKIRQDGAKECEKIFNSMEAYAIKNGLIRPVDVDELAGFFVFKFNTSTGKSLEDWETYVRTVDMREIYIDFAKYREMEINGKIDEYGEIIKENIVLENPIKSELQVLLPKMERKIKGKLNDKIWRAAYSEYLFNNNYFENKLKRIKTCNEFARLKWGENIKNQLLTTCKDDRERHIKTLTIQFRNLQV